MCTEGEYRGTFKTVSDKEHAEMISLYIEQGLSIEKIARQFNRSSRTPLLHIHKHTAPLREAGSVLFARELRASLTMCLLKRSEGVAGKAHDVLGLIQPLQLRTNV